MTGSWRLSGVSILSWGMSFFSFISRGVAELEKRREWEDESMEETAVGRAHVNRADFLCLQWRQEDEGRGSGVLDAKKERRGLCMR